ncbi:MAG: response regulator transcription factor [Anaerolineales bacterium]|nr:response regulator transcription factor [Anaerolineales bacterium]MCA9930602.1 response regulator transcription factor [Anaerolineales bacterium]
MSERPISILLVDDHEMLRDGLQLLLESEQDLQVIGSLGTGAEAIEQARALMPDVIVMDLGLPDMSGLDAIRMIREENTTSRIVVLSMYSRREFVLPAIDAGCDGYLPKSSTHTSLVQAIRVVLSGERFLHPKAATALVERFTQRTELELFESLSERERDVLRLAAMGFTSREIGEKLIISPKTADTYRQRAMEKLELTHRSDLIKFALRAGILDEYK